MKRQMAVLLLLAAMALPGVAQDLLRDPTRMPGAAGAVSSEPNATQRSLPLQPGQFAVLVRNGTRYLVVGARLYTVGQKIEGARIERLTETEVWLRDAAGVHKLPVFDGVQRRPQP